MSFTKSACDLCVWVRVVFFSKRWLELKYYVYIDKLFNVMNYKLSICKKKKKLNIPTKKRQEEIIIDTFIPNTWLLGWVLAVHFDQKREGDGSRV